MTMPGTVTKHTANPVEVQFIRKHTFTWEHPEWTIDFMHETGEYVALRHNDGQGTATVITAKTMLHLLNQLDDLIELGE